MSVVIRTGGVDVGKRAKQGCERKAVAGGELVGVGRADHEHARRVRLSDTALQVYRPHAR